MRGSSSAPTSRVLDVVELLSQPGGRPMRFSDIVRELELTQATAHSILKTLSDRGWITRDPMTKTFTLGPEISLLAARVDVARPLTQLARDATRRLVETTAMAASVVEKAGEHLVITAFALPEGSDTPTPNERIPYSPPFGVAFAAWDDETSQAAWVARGAADDAALAERLNDVLAHTRARGYDVDWMTPALAQAAHAIGALSGDAVPHNLRTVIDQLRVEFTSAVALSGASGRDKRPVATISAPVIDTGGGIRLVLAIHPLRTMTARAVDAAASSLLCEVGSLGRDSRH